MIGTPWVNQDGETLTLRADDFMVVAPYNDQVRLLQGDFDRTPDLVTCRSAPWTSFRAVRRPSCSSP